MLIGEQLTLPLYLFPSPTRPPGVPTWLSSCPPSFSVELLFILQSPAWCHLLCEAPLATHSFVLSAFCSSAVITSLGCLVSQL